MLPDVIRKGGYAVLLGQETETLRHRDFAHDIESKTLEPAAQVTHLARSHELGLECVVEKLDGGIHEALETDEVAHRIDVCDRFLQQPMDILGLSGEHHGDCLALVVWG